MPTEEHRAKVRAESDRIWKQAGREVSFEMGVKLILRLIWYGAILATIIKVWWPKP